MDFERFPATFSDVLQVVAIMCLAFGLFFSEKFLGYIEFWTYRVDLDVQPQLRPLGLNDVDVSSVDGSDTARGRLAISHDLIWNKHGLFCGGCEASLPGKFGDQVANSIMSAIIETFGAACGMPSKGIQDLRALFAHRGGGFCRISVLCPGLDIPISGINPV